MNSLTHNNFVLHAAKHYDNPNCENEDEFQDDLHRFKYVKRLFTKYLMSGEIKERLVLNHIVILYNLFGDECTRMLFLKLDGYWSLLVPFLKKLDRLPEHVCYVSKHATIVTNQIVPNEDIETRLKGI